MGSPRLSSRLALALSLLPPAAIAWFVYFHGTDAPYVDQFDFIPLLARDRQIGFFDLAALHNDHRIFFPRIIMLVLARVTGWNIRAEMAVTFALAAGILLIAWRRLRTGDLTPWALPLISLLIFTFAQWDNWIWGWQLQMMLNVLAVVGGLALASSPVLTPPRLAGVIALGVVAHYSFGNGVVYWPLAAWVVWATQRRWAPSLAVLAFGALSTGLYLIGYPHHRATFGLGASPLAMLAYTLVFLGSPLDPGAATVDWQVIGFRLVAAGLLAIAGLALVAWLARRSRNQEGLRGRTAFALGLCGYAAASGALTSVGRVVAGIGQATSPRYTVMAMLLWIGLVALAGRLRGWRWALVPVALLALAVQPPSLAMGLREAAYRRGLRDALLASPQAFHPMIDPARIAAGRAVLEAQHLSCFRDR